MVDGAQHIRYPQNTKEQKIPNAKRESSFLPKSNLETSFTCFFYGEKTWVNSKSTMHKEMSSHFVCGMWCSRNQLWYE